MSANLYEASHQWAQRPDDQRFESLASIYQACLGHASNAVVANVALRSLSVGEQGSDIVLIGDKGIPAKLTHYAFGQLSRRAGAPSEYLRSLPVGLATQALNHGLGELKAADPGAKMNLLFTRTHAGALATRAVTTDSYDRVWDHEVVKSIGMRLEGAGWRLPPARPARPGQVGTRIATAADILPGQGDFGLAIKVGDQIAPAGAYASDHDLFLFLVNQADPISDGHHLLNRGVFIQNSEVGDCALKLKVFTYDNVCGNHIVWGAGNVAEVSVRHVKSERLTSGRTLANAMAKWSVMARQLPSSGQMEATIEAAKAREIGATKAEVLENLFRWVKGKNLGLINRGVIEGAYEIAEMTPRYGSPRSVWGMVNGLTEYSQTTQYTDTRTDLDVQAGRVLEMAF